MTDERHMDETQPDQTIPGDRIGTESAAEPDSFADLPMQPTGSGVADEQTAFEQSELDAPPAGTAGHGNTGVTPPAIESGQPEVGEPDQRQTRNTEF